MDFDAIESLNEQELNELYDTGMYDMDGVRMGICGCVRPRYGVANFGDMLYGGCRHMQDEGVYSEPACYTWCRTRGFTLFFFDARCGCARYRLYGGEYGTVEVCPTD